ncbi:flavin reductase family protein [Deinococcus oregonensis]|uniref:Flavin reductase family protein n=1 Tax=Deinococcus oregonensis TaxID=1805970 RepID=A0ABV6ATW0_9DEIO
MHQVIQPKIMYFGTPVVLISTTNPDGTPNLAPLSSAWWINDSCMLGMSRQSQTVRNLERTGECVLNLPDDSLVGAVDRLALTTGREDVPKYKAAIGCEYIPDKFAHAGLTPLPAELVRVQRVLECPVHLEAQLVKSHAFDHGGIAALEVKVIRAHFETTILNPVRRHHVDPDRWRPLIMSFCEFYSLGGNVHSSRLAEVF